MSKQAFELLDLESGYKYTLETSTDILPSDFNLVLPDRNGTLALTKDVDDLSGKIVRGDIVVGDSKKLDGKALSEIALSDMSNVTLTPEMVNSLRGFTGSAGSAGTVGPIGLQGYTGSKGEVGVLETSINIGTNNVLDLNVANLFVKTLTANTSFTVSNLKPAGETNSFILEVTNGSYIISWWSNIKWSGGTPPTPTTNGTDIYSFYSYDGGNTWRGSAWSKDSK